KQDWVTANSGQAETESEKTQPGNQHRLASYPIRQATGDTARERRDDHHHREQAAGRDGGKRKSFADFWKSDPQGCHHHRWHQIGARHDAECQTLHRAATPGLAFDGESLISGIMMQSRGWPPITRVI